MFYSSHRSAAPKKQVPDVREIAKRRLDLAAADVCTVSGRGRTDVAMMIVFREYEVALAIAQEFGVAGDRMPL